MADVYDYVVSTGVITPDSGEILTDVQNEYLSAFGEDLNIAPNTPQGILIATETLARDATADNNAALANQINPNESGGVFLDALMALTGATRSPATYSTVLCTLTGVVGTSIPAGAQISDSDGDLYQLIATTVIPTGGSIANVPFQSVEPGAIPGVASTLTTIVSNVLGWETVTNPAAAVPGVLTQSDVSARALRQNTLALQGTGLAEATLSALYDPNTTPGVTSATFQENIEGFPQTINGVLMKRNSLYTCVEGSATPLSIATTLTSVKGGGCGYNNGLGIPQNVPITNSYSGQIIPVLFDTPSIVNIAITVTVHAFTAVQNIQSAVQNAILQYMSGGISNEPGFVVGGTVSPSQIAGAINILVPGLFVQEVQVAIQSVTQQGTIVNTMDTVTGLTYNAPISPWFGIATGMGVMGAGIPSMTTVASLVGSTGVTLSHNATLSATEILTFVPTLTYQTTQIPIAVWQQAVTSVPFITVVQV